MQCSRTRAKRAAIRPCMDHSVQSWLTSMTKQRGYRPTLDSAEICLKAHVNPLNGRELITTEQADALSAMLASQRGGEQANARVTLDHFLRDALSYLQQTTTPESRAAAMAEVMQDREQYYSTHTRVTFQPVGTPKEERTPRAQALHGVAKRQSPRASGAMGEFADAWKSFTTQHGFSLSQIGQACASKKGGGPLSESYMRVATQKLYSGKGLEGPFVYARENPDTFFAALERQKTEQTGMPTPISAAEREHVLKTLAAAHAEMRQKGNQR